MTVRSEVSPGVPAGLFLTLEGIEGCGKSTHARRLAERIRALGLEVVLTREPGGTPLGEAVRGLLLDAGSDPPTPPAELLLLLAARSQHLEKTILPALSRGQVVLSDRYADASLAYQGGGRGLGLQTVARVNEFATGGILPDLTLLLDLPVSAALERIHHRRQAAGTLDRFDQEEERFYRTVRESYLALAEREPDRFRVIPTDSGEEEVAGQVWRAVEPILSRHRQAGGFDPAR